MRTPVISYRPLVLSIGALGAMAIASVNPWAGVVLLALAVLALTWQLIGTPATGAARQSAAADLDFDPMSARDYNEMRRRYRRD